MPKETLPYDHPVSPHLELLSFWVRERDQVGSEIVADVCDFDLLDELTSIQANIDRHVDAILRFQHGEDWRTLSVRTRGAINRFLLKARPYKPR